jgi:hypothetical protein
METAKSNLTERIAAMQQPRANFRLPLKFPLASPNVFARESQDKTPGNIEKTPEKGYVQLTKEEMNSCCEMKTSICFKKHLRLGKSQK